jgi:hypothetical protein
MVQAQYICGMNDHESGSVFGSEQDVVPFSTASRTTDGGLRQLEHEVHYSGSSLKITNVWNYTSIPAYSYVARCWVKLRGNFSFFTC